MGRRGLEDVLLDRDIFVIKLVNESQRSDGLPVCSEARFSEFLRNSLLLVRKARKTENDN
jgi:hypothetical protein